MLLLAVAACGANAQKKRTRKPPPPDPAQVAMSAVLQADRDFARTGAAKDLPASMNFVAEDVRSYSAGVMRTGKLAFRENWAEGFQDPNWSITWAPVYAEASTSGDLGYTTGSFEIHAKSADGAPVVRTGSYVTIWRKQPDGSWKVALDIGNFAPVKSSTQ